MAAPIRKRTTINYLSNTELLHEINESKKSYSSFIDDEYSNYTVIIKDQSEITPELISKAKDIKAHQINQANLRKMLKDGLSKKEIEEQVQATAIGGDNITEDQIVYRIMTYEHIPEEIQTNKKNLLNRIKFPPFKHYAFVNGEFKEVGRSHWKDGLENGHFSADHGKVSNNLSKALIMLTKRYATKPNFSGYTYIEEMISTALLQLSVIALQFDESKAGPNSVPNPFAYYTQVSYTSFLKVLKYEKNQRNIRDQLMQDMSGMTSFSYQMDNED